MRQAMQMPRTRIEPTPPDETVAEKVARLEAELAAARQDLAAVPVATRVRVGTASSSTDSSSLREGATATDRWSRDDLRVRLDGAPKFRITDRVDDDTLARICAAYTAITGDPVRSERPWKKNLVAAAYRVHGDDFLSYLRDLFEANGTATNLLGILRSSPPRNLAPGVPADPAPSEDARDGRMSTHPDAPGGGTLDVNRPWSVQEVAEALGEGQRDEAGPPEPGWFGEPEDSDPRWPFGATPLQVPERGRRVERAPDVSAHPMRAASSSGPSFSVTCSDYRAHQSAHRRVGDGWTCDACAVLV